MSGTALLAATVTIIAALLGYVATYINNVRLNQRQARLDRVNRQLSEFYGPLLAIRGAQQEAYQGFRRNYGFAPGHFREEPPEDDLQTFRVWMKTAFMPSNRRAYEVILTKADLLIDNEMPDVLLKFCGHVLAYEVILKRWDDNDFSEHLSVVPFPSEMYEYVNACFSKLKEEQSQLLGTGLRRTT